MARVPGDALRCFWNPAVQPSLWLPPPSTGEARHCFLDPLIRRDGQRWVVVPRGETTCFDQAMQGSSSFSFEVPAAQLHNSFTPKGCCHNLRLVSLRSAALSQICHNLTSEQKNRPLRDGLNTSWGLVFDRIGETGFEPAASCSQSKRATKLRHSPAPPHSRHRRAFGQNHWPD